MAPIWNAALAACAPDGAVRLEHFVRRVERAPAAIARFAMDCFASFSHSPLRIVTLSCSGSVLHALGALASIHVSCSESRPALEGRRLAETLVARGVPVTYYGDAAIGDALADAHAVVIGADAIGPEWFLNKSGTRMLAASASHQGIPVYVVASRDKFVSAAVAERLDVREEAPSEIWAAAPQHVTVRNPYFERIPIELVTTAITDLGLLGAAMIPDVCASIHDRATVELLAQLA
jgi:translation initiation factor 2B subunit (eIF-2B alpha/beta/delta family)